MGCIAVVPADNRHLCRFQTHLEGQIDGLLTVASPQNFNRSTGLGSISTTAEPRCMIQKIKRKGRLQHRLNSCNASRD
jgi:hypothetical protein